jgi:protein-L-isoaspartate(D-aspartate) O-methyltransferase
VKFWRESDQAKMVRKHLRARGLTSPRLLQAFSEVPRERFVPDRLREWAYADRPLDIGFGQTISQPYIVALTADLLQIAPHEKILEIGTGSGYAAAILAKLGERVITVERVPELADTARKRLRELGFENVTVVCADGTQGYPPEAPYDAIAVAAGGPCVPRDLKEQLAVGGRLVIPVGEHSEQNLVKVTRIDQDTFQEQAICKVRFVPLVGAQGWSA